MEPLVHRFDWPDRFVVGTVGPPGSRTFFLQARSGDQVVSVSLEKQQTAALAERIEEVLDELMAEDGNPYSIPALTPEELVDTDPLEQPVEEQFRAGAMSLGWDPSTAQVVIEAFPIPEIDLEAIDPELDAALAASNAGELGPDDVVEIEVVPEEVLLVRIPVGSARAFAKSAREIVKAGRPLCVLCNAPMDSEAEHVCELPDGFR